MKGLTKGRKNFAFALAALLLLLPQAAFAAVNFTAQAQPTSVQVGDTLEVILTVNGKDMAAAEGFFTYDPAVLAYAESEGGASDGFLNMVSAAKGGSDTLSARVRFTATAAGSAQIVFSLEKVLGYDGKEQGGGEATVSVTVAAPEPTPTPTPLNYAVEGVLAQNVKGVTESLYIWRSLENVTLPSRYAETTLEYHGEKVAAATVEDSDAPVLLYLSDATGDAGGYYIFHAETDMLYRYQTISSVSKSYIILAPDGSVALPEGFTETKLVIDETEYVAWKSQDAQGEIYLVYARNSDGEVGYFVYNAADESLQRYAVMPARPVAPTLSPVATPAQELVEATPAPEVTAEGITLSNTAFYAVCGGGALLVLIIVWLAISRSVENARRKRRAAARKAAHDRMKKQEIEQ
ncbi:MAG: hypothetical protein EOM66_07160 [Clostridia bacterium]|nr:hypothetical protein [Clostridia bacterium]